MLFFEALSSLVHSLFCRLRKQGFQTSDTEDEGGSHRQRRSKKKSKKRSRNKEKSLRQTLSSRFSSSSAQDASSKRKSQQTKIVPKKPRRIDSPPSYSCDESMDGSMSSLQAPVSLPQHRFSHDVVSEDDAEAPRSPITRSPTTKSKSWKKRTKTALGTLAKQPVRLARSTRKRFTSGGRMNSEENHDVVYRNSMLDDGDQSLYSQEDDDRSTSTTKRMNMPCLDQLVLPAPPLLLSLDDDAEEARDMALQVFSPDDDERLYCELGPEYIGRLNDLDESDRESTSTMHSDEGGRRGLSVGDDERAKFSPRRRRNLTHVLGTLAKQPVRLAKSTPKALSALAKQPVRLAKSTPNAIVASGGTVTANGDGILLAPDSRMPTYNGEDSISQEKIKGDGERDNMSRYTLQEPSGIDFPIAELQGFETLARDRVRVRVITDPAGIVPASKSKVAGKREKEDWNASLGDSSSNIHADLPAYPFRHDGEPWSAAEHESILGDPIRSKSCCFRRETQPSTTLSRSSSVNFPLRRKRSSMASNRPNRIKLGIPSKGDEGDNSFTSPRSRRSSVHRASGNIGSLAQLSSRQQIFDDISISSLEDSDPDDHGEDGSSTRFGSSLMENTDSMIAPPAMPMRHVCVRDFDIRGEEDIRRKMESLVAPVSLCINNSIDVSAISLEDEDEDSCDGSADYSLPAGTRGLMGPPRLPSRHDSDSDSDNIDTFDDDDDDSIDTFYDSTMLREDAGDTSADQHSLPNGMSGVATPPCSPCRHDSIDASDDSTVLENDGYGGADRSLPEGASCLMDLMDPPRLPCRHDSINSFDYVATMSDGDSNSSSGPICKQVAACLLDPSHGCGTQTTLLSGEMMHSNVDQIFAKHVSWTGTVTLLTQPSSSLPVLVDY
jgi:hypothetical protein